MNQHCSLLILSIRLLRGSRSAPRKVGVPQLSGLAREPSIFIFACSNAAPARLPGVEEPRAVPWAEAFKIGCEVSILFLSLPNNME